LDHLTSVQLSEWEAYDRLDPIGTWREDFRMAYVSSLITNLAISIHGKKGTKPMNIMDFMPKWDSQEPENTVVKQQSVEEMKKALLQIAQAQNKKVARVNKPPTITKKKKDG
jgi:hypothetical protein